MDSLRGSFDGTDNDLDDVAVDEAPPPGIGQDERRMQVRAYNHWAGLLEERNFPSIEDLHPDSLPDFAPFSVLLDFSTGMENPGIAYLGTRLAQECGADPRSITSLADVPSRSLLSRITDHYMQILANQTPIGFEAEFVNQRAQTVMYRGILLPFSSDDDTIDFIYGVINWKEAIDHAAQDELLLEIDQVLTPAGSATDIASMARTEVTPLASWADGPVTEGSVAGTPLPQPSFGQIGFDAAGDMSAVKMSEQPAALQVEIPSVAMIDGDPELVAVSLAEPDAADTGLADLLATAREMAMAASGNEDRTRYALYSAISRAYDFSIAAGNSQDELAEMLEDAGLTMQQRAPMTPIVKLVFGGDYDKTRLTEYAAALTHAERLNLPQGALADFLRDHDGGLKGVVKAERALRREEAGRHAISREGPGKQLTRQLRAMPLQGFDAITREGSEFALVLIRRGDDRQVSVLGEVPEDASLVQRAARHLLG